VLRYLDAAAPFASPMTRETSRSGHDFTFNIEAFSEDKTNPETIPQIQQVRHEDDHEATLK